MGEPYQHAVHLFPFESGALWLLRTTTAVLPLERTLLPGPLPASPAVVVLPPVGNWTLPPGPGSPIGASSITSTAVAVQPVPLPRDRAPPPAYHPAQADARDPPIARRLSGRTCHGRLPQGWFPSTVLGPSVWVADLRLWAMPSPSLPTCLLRRLGHPDQRTIPQALASIGI